MRGSRVAILSLALGWTVGGCAESTTLTKEEDLTEFEAAQMASFLIGRSFTATGVDMSSNAQTVTYPSASTFYGGENFPTSYARVEIDEDHTLMGDCILGGSLKVSQSVEGFVDNETKEFDIHAVQKQVYEDCTGAGESGDFTFTLNSSPDVAVDLSIARDASNAVTGSGTVFGAVDWEAGDRIGRCEIDFVFSMEGQPGRTVITSSGRICGISFSQNISVTT